MTFQCSEHVDYEAVAAMRRQSSYRLVCRLCSVVGDLRANIHKNMRRSPGWAEAGAQEPETKVPLDDPGLIEWLQAREVMEP